MSGWKASNSSVSVPERKPITGSPESMEPVNPMLEVCGGFGVVRGVGADPTHPHNKAPTNSSLQVIGTFIHESDWAV